MINLDADDILLLFQIPHHFVHQLMHDHIVPSELGVNKTEMRTLMSVRRGGGLTMLELGHRVGIPKGSLTSVVDKLITLELVVRSQHPDDRRKVVVAITDKGLETGELMDTHLRNHLGKKFMALSEEQRTDLFQALRTIHNISEQLQDSK
ncbi:MarR family winged helix-turn-helix transcriptional regulator [Vibrio sp. WJH972]